MRKCLSGKNVEALSCAAAEGGNPAGVASCLPGVGDGSRPMRFDASRNTHVCLAKTLRVCGSARLTLESAALSGACVSRGARRLVLELFTTFSDATQVAERLRSRDAALFRQRSVRKPSLMLVEHLECAASVPTAQRSGRPGEQIELNAEAIRVDAACCPELRRRVDPWCCGWLNRRWWLGGRLRCGFDRRDRFGDHWPLDFTGLARAGLGAQRLKGADAKQAHDDRGTAEHRPRARCAGRGIWERSSA